MKILGSIFLLLAAISSANALTCYSCSSCGTVDLFTPTTTCSDTTVFGVTLPSKCTTLTTADGTSRGCVPAAIDDGCIEILGTNSCYCSTDRCNSENGGVSLRAASISFPVLLCLGILRYIN